MYGIMSITTCPSPVSDTNMQSNGCSSAFLAAYNSQWMLCASASQEDAAHTPSKTQQSSNFRQCEINRLMLSCYCD